MSTHWSRHFTRTDGRPHFIPINTPTQVRTLYLVKHLLLRSKLYFTVMSKRVSRLFTRSVRRSVILKFLLSDIACRRSTPSLRFQNPTVTPNNVGTDIPTTFLRLRSVTGVPRVTDLRMH